MKEKNIEYYERDLHRNAKLQTLEELMKHELVRGVNDGALVYENDEMKHSISGYPHFMQEKEDRLKFKEKQRKDIDQINELEFKDPVHQKLKEKVVEAEQDVISEAEDIDDEAQYERDEDDLYDEKLYHLNTKKNYVHPNNAMADNYDFHQRKSKEIRRLQYSAGLGRAKPQKIGIVRYPVWVVFESAPYRKIPYPANIVVTLPKGVKKAEQLQVTEGDDVHIELEPVDGAPSNTPQNQVLPGLPSVIDGLSDVPVEDDGDCDFVAVPGDGTRWPIMITFREIPPYRDVDNTNCEIFGPDGKSRGRARFDLLDGENCIVYNKGYLADNQNQMTLVLVKRINDGQILLKMVGRQRRLEIVSIEEILFFQNLNVKLTVLTLEEDHKERLPRQVYFVDGMDCHENIELLTGEEGLAVCTDCNDYKGKVQYDGGHGFRLNLYPSNDWTDQFVRVVMDDDGKGPGFFDVETLNSQIVNVLKLRYGGPWIINSTLSIAQRGKGGKPDGINQEVLRRTPKRTPVKTGTNTISRNATQSSKKYSQRSEKHGSSRRSGRKEKKVLGVVGKPTTRFVESTYIKEEKKVTEFKPKNEKRVRKKKASKKVGLTKQQVRLYFFIFF